MSVALIGTISAFVAVAVCLAALPVAAWLGRRLGWLDEPGARKRHAASVPFTGGCVVFGCLAAGGLAALLLGGFNTASVRIASFAVAAAVVFAVGLLEDLRGCPVAGRVAAQGAAACLVAFLEPVARIGPVEIPPLAGSLLAVVWLVGVTNAINLLDGLDGLAASVACLVAGSLAVLGVLQGDSASTAVAAVLCAACAGFLRWNWRPARIFLGDSGALTVGFVLAWLALNLASGATGEAGTLAPFMMLGLPVFDTLMVAAGRFTESPARRLRERFRRVVTADRRHLHYLLAAAKGERAVVLRLCAFAGVVCLLALLAVASGMVVFAAALAPAQLLAVAWMRRAGRRAAIRRAARASAAPLGLLALLAAASPEAATAQRSRLDDGFRSEARMQFGPLYLTPSFTLDRFGVDTNVFNTFEAERDFVVAGTPAVDAWIPFRRRALLTASVAARGEWFERFEGERSVNSDARARFDLAAGPLTFFAAGRRLDTRQRPSFDIDVRARRVETETNGGVRVALAPKLSLDLEVAEDRVRFDGDEFFEGTRLAETLNREERAARAAFRWQATPLSTFVLAGESREMRFDLSPERDSDNLVVTLGGEFEPRAAMAGSAEVGVRRFEALGAAVSDVTEVVASAELEFALPADVTATLEASRDIEYSFSPLYLYYVLNRYGVGIGRRIGNGPFDLSARVLRDENEYLGGPGRRDVIMQHFVTLGYRLNESVRIGLRVGDVRRTSTAYRGFEGLQAGLVFEYGS